MKKLIVLTGFIITFLGGYFLGRSDEIFKENVEANELDLVELDLGKPFPIPELLNANLFTNAPWADFRVPLPDNSRWGFLYDYKVTVDTETGIIARITAERGFRDKTTCMDALNQLKPIILKRYPDFNLSIERSDYSEQVKGLELELSCSVTKKSPYYTFTYSIASVEIVETILAKIRNQS